MCFFFNVTATTEIYTLSLHDSLPISVWDTGVTLTRGYLHGLGPRVTLPRGYLHGVGHRGDRKSTRLNSSHLVISYAVFCLKKKRRSDVAPLRTAVSHVSINFSIDLQH